MYYWHSLFAYFVIRCDFPGAMYLGEHSLKFVLMRVGVLIRFVLVNRCKTASLNALYFIPYKVVCQVIMVLKNLSSLSIWFTSLHTTHAFFKCCCEYKRFSHRNKYIDDTWAMAHGTCYTFNVIHVFQIYLFQ